MNIILSENLRELRKKKNNTQEDLAEFLTVSITAVSKWERGECYPDIEFLPKIASYYDISVDDLLGVGEIKKKERIKEFQEQSNYFRNIGDVKSNLAIWREAQKEFPNDWSVLHNLMYALSHDGKKENLQEIIEIGEKILEKCTINDYRYGAIQILCFSYIDLGNIEKAKEYANMSPDSSTLLCHVLKGDELAEHCQNNITRLAESLAQEIYFYAWYRGGVKGEKAKCAFHKALKVYELIYENGDFGFCAFRMSEIYNRLAEISAEQQNTNETLDYLVNFAKYAIISDTQENFKHISLLINRLSYDTKRSSKNYMSNNSYLMLQEIENSRYDFCRDDERFMKLTNNLKKVAVSGK